METKPFYGNYVQPVLFEETDLSLHYLTQELNSKTLN